jgi:DNA-binding SARP family transcriptional activator
MVYQAERAREQPQLTLLNAFELHCDGAAVPITLPAQRVLGFLAVQDRPVPRDYVAGTLWIDSSEQRATGSLRSALWRLRRCGEGLVEVNGRQLALSPRVRVDSRLAADWARRLLDPAVTVTDLDVAQIPRSGDLLPGWYDDWVLVERERLRELLLHALERLCDALLEEGRYGQALEAGHAAVRMEPLRESGHRSVIRVHLAEGNQADALRQYHLFRRLIRQELRLEPSGQMHELMGELATR